MQAKLSPEFRSSSAIRTSRTVCTGLVPRASARVLSVGPGTATIPGSTNAGGDPEFNGYRYRILTKGQSSSGVTNYVVDDRMTGGFAILTYPVEYRNTGLASFLIGQDGALYQKDLGEDTANVASLTEYTQRTVGRVRLYLSTLGIYE